MGAVMVLFERKPEWTSAKLELSSKDFMKKIKEFDRDSVKTSTLNKLEKYVNNGMFLPEKVCKISIACSAFVLWVKAIYCYASSLPPKEDGVKEEVKKMETKKETKEEETKKEEVKKEPA